MRPLGNNELKPNNSEMKSAYPGLRDTELSTPGVFGNYAIL